MFTHSYMNTGQCECGNVMNPLLAQTSHPLIWCLFHGDHLSALYPAPNWSHPNHKRTMMVVKIFVQSHGEWALHRSTYQYLGK